MAHEITFNTTTGLTLTARLVQAGAVVGAAISMTESGTVAGHYTGSVPGGTAAGIYSVRVLNGSTLVGDGTLDWTGTAERQAATASDVPSAASIASAVWSATDRALSAEALTAADVWAHVTRTLTSGGDGGGSDPLLSATSGYASGTAGAALHRLNATPGTGPLLPTPAAPDAADLCRLYGYLQMPNGEPAPNAQIEFELVGGPVLASGRLISGRRFTAKTDKYGALASREGPYIDLVRTDTIETSGTAATYRITCDALQIKGLEVTLAAELVDLKSLLITP